MRLEGRTVLVTAAGQGIGRAAALALAVQAAHVITTNLSANFLDYSGAHGAGQADTVDGGVTI